MIERAPRRSRLGLLVDPLELPVGRLGAVLEDLGALATECIPFLTTDVGWLRRVLDANLDAVLPLCGAASEAGVIAALNLAGIAVAGGRDRLATLGGDRLLLSSLLRAHNIPVLPVFASRAAPPLPLPVDVTSERALSGSRWLKATTAHDLAEMKEIFDALDEPAWFSPCSDERYVVGMLFGDIVGTIGITTHEDHRGLAQVAEVPAELDALDAAEIDGWARRVAEVLGLSAPTEIELCRFEGRLVVRAVRRNLTLDSASPLGHLLTAHQLERTEIWQALLDRSVTSTPRQPHVSDGDAAEATVH